ncbi:calcium channel protein, partial [Mortierella sp. AD094]
MATSPRYEPLPSQGQQGDHNENTLILTSTPPPPKEEEESMTTNTIIEFIAPENTIPGSHPILDCIAQFFVEAASRVINLSGSSQSQQTTPENFYMPIREPSEAYDDNRSQTTADSLAPYKSLPLKGHSLFIFGPHNPLRNQINRLLNQTWSELFMLLLIIVNLVFLMIKVSSPAGNDTVWGSHWTDYGLMAIFCIYTLEIAMKVIVCGVVSYPGESEQILYNDMHDKLVERVRGIFVSENRSRTQSLHHRQISGSLDKKQPREKVGPIPFLRHTFNQIDLIAVVCYWIDVTLMLTGVAGVHNIYFFKTMAAMRTLRLLKITPGTFTILQSLKKSTPLLANVALFIAFFFVIFSIIGVQSFQGSFSRRCVSRDPSLNITLDQACGGYINNITLEKMPYITLSGTTSSTHPKGYICPFDFDTAHNMHETISFDTIYSAMVPVYVLMAGQTWTDLMYRMMDAEYKWSSLYFVFVMIVMNFWILNLFVAVITEMFAKIREDSQNNSAFTSRHANDENKTPYKSRISPQKWAWLDIYEFFWVIIVIVDLVIQCLPRYESPQARLDQIERMEFLCSLAFVFDIATRFLIYLPAYREFFTSKKNMVDLFLVFATLIIQVPVIRQSNVYMYLTIFQVLRIYRPIIYYDRLRNLIERVVGSWAGLLNLILFIALFLAVVSVMAGLLFREILLPSITSGNAPVMTFQDFYVSYLGVYQLFSGENWTDILYSVMSAEVPWHQVIVAAVFLIAFYSVANFILVNMLIAIIMENFDEKSDDVKHKQQIDNAVAKSGRSTDEQEKITAYLEGLRKPYPESIGEGQFNDILEKLKGAMKGEQEQERIMAYLERSFEPYPESIDRQEIGKIAANSGCTTEEQKIIQDYLEEYFNITQTDWARKMHQKSVRWLLMGDMPSQVEGTNPTHDTASSSGSSSKQSPSDEKNIDNEHVVHYSLFLFSPKNKFRRFLQSFIEPHRKKRDGDPPRDKVLSRSFNGFITLAIVASVIVAAITSPLWRLKQSKLDPADQSVAIHVSDIAFPVIFTLEFVLRVIADGLVFTPDAYLRSYWNWVDSLVLISMYVPLFTNTSNSRGYARFFRSLKSLRALRLVNQSVYIKKTFHAVLVAGFPQLLSAVMLSLALLVPFAIYGLRLFKGLFFSCNDNASSINTLNDCVVEFVGSNNVLMPRVWSNPSVYSFDNFFASLLILFEIVSQEGWIGVMSSARNVVGLGMQPNTDASRYNGIFFLIFNLAGGYFVTSLFVATIIENYTKRTGTASMTADQKGWMDLKKIIRSTEMSKSTPPKNPTSVFCSNIASSKRGWFPRLLTFVTMLLAIALMSEHVNSGDWEGIKNWIYLPLLLFYMVEIFVRIIGLGWRSYIRNRWNIYNSFVSFLALLITIFRICGLSSQPLIQVQKLFLVAILVRMVPQNDSLNQLFMTMIASFSSIASLFSVWLVVFAVYAVMFMEMFGLTSYGPHGGENVNFRNFGTTMLMMARMSTGEGWNDLMHDFALNPPNCVNHRESYLISDCGSTPWAYSLFISFNVISMYIFTNMFIVVVMHNFSYVYQISSGFSSIDRIQIRSFKNAWALFDTDRVGYIQEENIIEFLMKLRGVFDMRIYKGSHKLRNLTELLKETNDKDNVTLAAYRKEVKIAELALAAQGYRPPQIGLGTRPALTNLKYRPALVGLSYNTRDLDAEIAHIIQGEIQHRRWVFNAVYAETIMSMKPIPKTETTRNGFNLWPRNQASASAEEMTSNLEMGPVGIQYRISFEEMLDIVARNKLLKDDQCFSLAEALRHRKTMDRVRAHVDVMNIRRGLLRMIYRRRFLKYYGDVQEIRARAAHAEGHPVDNIEPANLANVGSSSNRRNEVTGELIEIEELRATWRKNHLPSQGKLSIADKIIRQPEKTTDEDEDEDDDEDAIDFKDILNTISEMECESINSTSPTNAKTEKLTFWGGLKDK